MARNVYLVYYFDFDDGNVVEKVFSSKKKANKYIELCKKKTPFYEYEVKKEELF